LKSDKNSDISSFRHLGMPSFVMLKNADDAATRTTNNPPTRSTIPLYTVILIDLMSVHWYSRLTLLVKQAATHRRSRRIVKPDLITLVDT